MAVPVIVRIAVRAAPVFWATVNWTVPFPEPEAPCVTERKLALLVAVQAQLFGVVTEIEAEPPAAEKLVVVTPVMIWQPGPGDGESEPHACVTASVETAKTTKITLQNRMRIFMPASGSTFHSTARAKRVCLGDSCTVSFKDASTTLRIDARWLTDPSSRLVDAQRCAASSREAC